METVSRTARMPSTAAWSAAILSPRPTQRPAASAAASVTRTSSSARLRSGATGTPVEVTRAILRVGHARRWARPESMRTAEWTYEVAPAGGSAEGLDEYIVETESGEPVGKVTTLLEHEGDLYLAVER